MIKLIDYGVGNIQAFLNVFKRLGIPAEAVSTPEALQGVTHLILPGVGAFDHAMTLFNQSGLRDSVEQLVLADKIPIIGICVGMQMLASGSEEGTMAGLNWIPGQVRSFMSNPQSRHLPMPHMGWNDVKQRTDSALTSNFISESKFYFLHSYYFDCTDKSDVIATAEYGFEFDCIVGRENIFGIQCHPEKSHSSGLTLLKNFSEIGNHA
ncbi:imidazole glycerol phosphate synthase, glutamine amidotransferase subunit [Yersinia ruckeri]|uniref:imidazole glycerol phosphate synthase subunit HisH n=1 Tax=Yersinia ruckeri TaxID=29486 RepID=UPI0004E45DC0|nr:imidazole glycerol phosphate synthase subunit HisH [Yersinia ruckeri]ARZ02557.1 imidazole glycerol phosphate synthase subunit HisH [Yersinia ruckeri]EKN4197512.1 imidazole glycerol phosphate synthase subunit HisH [Yersinia ruckeri]EKN4204685.1 imidazole glycerol phosphate synthase subunit HisH [Yersinia ruckeri]EKN4699104.1 imidazole glycerol phosphate synthase subunit HisH [Yersinia ruckeri]EKN4702023.1 imidazole glycerol phosphate synthase subunit HisH [Yersinia ruckeri]